MGGNVISTEMDGRRTVPGSGKKRSQWLRLISVVKPFFLSRDGWRAYSLLGLLVVFSFSINGLNIVSSYLNRDLMTYLAQNDTDRFYFLALQTAGIFCVITIFAVLFRFVEERFGLYWRDWLTQYFMQTYITRRAYCWLNGRTDIDNPDQRIAEDIRTFCATTLSFFLILLNSAVSFVAFTSVLWSITPWLVYGALGYATLGSLITYLLGYKLINLNFLQLKKEADFRYELIQVREHSESIALNQRNERKELNRLQKSLRAVVDNLKRVISVNRNLGFFTTGYNYWAQLVPIVIVAPLYLKGLQQFGVVTQAVSAFAFVLGSFSLMVTEFQRITSFVAVISRLGALAEAIENPPPREKGPQILVEEAEGNEDISYEQVTILNPEDHTPILLDLNFKILPGHNLAITGSNRTGKSLLLKATAGTWLLGEGHIKRPTSDQVMFLPHHPYFSRSSLRDLLTNNGLIPHVSDEILIRTIKTLQLDSLWNRVGDLDVEQEWFNSFSASELQLLAVGELLIASPRFAYLDESLSALGHEAKLRIYELLKNSSITLISTVSDNDLISFHDQVLELPSSGMWTLRSNNK